MDLLTFMSYNGVEDGPQHFSDKGKYNFVGYEVVAQEYVFGKLYSGRKQDEQQETHRSYVSSEPHVDVEAEWYKEACDGQGVDCETLKRGRIAPGRAYGQSNIDHRDVTAVSKGKRHISGTEDIFEYIYGYKLNPEYDT